MLVNFSNYRYELWPEGLIDAAKEYGEVVDMSFPNVDPTLDEAAILALADVLSEKIIKENPDAVICQGEFTLLYAIVNRLKAAGIKVMVLCLERSMDKSTNHPVFEFVRFREFK